MNLRWQIAQRFELQWWRRYLGNKDKTTYLNWKKAYWKGFLEKSGLQLMPGQAILDVGCGPAGIYVVLEGYDIHAIDPLLDKYAAFLPHFDPKDWPYVHFETSTLENFRTDRTFKTVFCINAINHVADLDVSMNHLVELVEPGGELAFSIDAHNWSLFKHVLRWIPGDILHPHQYDLEEYRTMLTSRGLSIRSSVLIKRGFIFNYYLIVADKP